MATDTPTPELGLGLIGLGRPWGVRFQELPSEEQSDELLLTALELGIRFWDTAASYGASEQRVGRFLRQHPADVFVATKFGDHWEPDDPDSRMDHSYDALCRSLDRSLQRLGRIDLLQVHRASAEALRSADVHRALEYARSQGVRELGASVKELDAVDVAFSSGLFQWLQIPYNRRRPEMEPVFGMAREKGVRIIVNRPFAEGALLETMGAAGAFHFVLAQRFDGVVIPGTASPRHLRENAAAYVLAK